MFTLKKLAAKNLCHRKFQSIILCLFLFLTTIGIFAGGLLENSMKTGLAVTEKRIGADIIVVPDKFVTDVEDSLFQGKACTVNFDAEWKEKIDQVEGIALTGTQLYLASIGNMECCNDTVQIIAVDMDTDFTVGPWLAGNGINKIANNEIIVGCNVGKKKGDNLKYFGRDFKVIEVLEETGMGYDSCVFLSYEAADEIAGDAVYAKTLPFSAGKKVISMVLIDVADEYEISEVSRNIKEMFAGEGIAVYEVTSMLGELAGKVGQFQIFGSAAEILVLVMAAISLFAIVALTLSLRLNEFGSLQSVGITKREISVVLIWEYSYLIMIAAAAGIILCSIIIAVFHTALRQLLEVPYHSVSLTAWLGMCGKVLLLDACVCAAACGYSVCRIRMFQPADMVKEV